MDEPTFRTQPEQGGASATTPDRPAVASDEAGLPSGKPSGGIFVPSRKSPGPRASWAERVGQTVVGVLLAAWLALGVALTPSPTGTGTHTVLGLPPCGMLLATGHPCPTCGVTTSFVLAAHGRPLEAIVNQPFGLAVFLGVLGGLAFTIVSLATGRSWCDLLSVFNVTTAVVIISVIALISWAYKWSVM